MIVRDAVAVVRLHDAEGRNRITAALTEHLLAELAEAERDDRVRAVVIEGREDVFCAGASRADLHIGWTEEVDRFMRAPLRCALPVVAGVRGNALGGGLLFALYADVAVFGETTSVGANFMRYGFTPCGGSTHLLPLRLGSALGSELLLTGRVCTGRELRARGAGVKVVPQRDVEATAHRIAARIAEAPRESLIKLKRQCAARLESATDAALARELPVHRETVATEEVQRLLDKHYGETRTP
jgi:polyketide biosynthesis enoyl-CoA hydratase PksI